MTNDFLIDMLANWDVNAITITAIDSIHKSSWDIDGIYILKHGDSVPEIEKSIAFSKLLSKQNIIVTQYLETKDKKTFVMVDDGYWCLMTKLKGIHVNIFEKKDEFAFYLGKVIANLHVALNNIEHSIGCFDSDFRSEFENHIIPEINSKNIPVSRKITDFIKEKLDTLYLQLPHQIIHRDMHLENLLFENDVLSGYIDFDLSVRSVRIFDLGYCLLSMLVKQTENAEICKRWRGISKLVIAEYDSILHITTDEKKAIAFMMIYIELIFVSFWSHRGNIEQRDEALKMTNWLWVNMYDLC